MGAIDNKPRFSCIPSDAGEDDGTHANTCDCDSRDKLATRPAEPHGEFAPNSIEALLFGGRREGKTAASRKPRRAE